MSRIGKIAPVVVFLDQWPNGMIGYRFQGPKFIKPDVRGRIWHPTELTREATHLLLRKALHALPATLSNTKRPRKEWLAAQPHPHDLAADGSVRPTLPAITIVTNIPGMKQAADELLNNPSPKYFLDQNSRRRMLEFDIRWVDRDFFSLRWSPDAAQHLVEQAA